MSVWGGYVRPKIWVLTALLTAACSTAPETPATSLPTFPRLAAQETFAMGFDNISRKHLEAVSVEAIALEGMKGLASIDPELSVNKTGDSINVRRGDEVVARLPLPKGKDAGSWAALTVNASLAGRSHSTELRQASTEKIYEAVFDGALSSLDIFSRYAGAEEAKKNRSKRDGFGGIGISFRLRDGHFVIVSVMEGTPAGKAELLKDDRITHIDGVSVAGLKLKEVTKKLRGPLKSKVSLTVSRKTAAIPFNVHLVRAHVVAATVFEKIDNGVIVLRIKSFNQDTTRSLRKKFDKLRSQLGARFRGVILDLRGNPGGLLRQAIKIADLFLVQGEIINTRGRHPDSLQHYEASGDDLAFGYPMAILVDGKSASAAEVLAAALQDRGRAVVIGTASYGKGTVQTVIRLPNEGEITLTWSRLLAPSGYVLHNLGVLPVICTSGRAKADSGLLTSMLDRRDKTAENLAAWRKTDYTDEIERRRLRKTCLPERHRKSVELDVARRLILNRPLYARALSLTASATAAHMN